MIPLHRFAAVVLVAASAACAGSIYLPGQPGAPDTDLSGQDVREDWLDDNPQTDEEIREAMREGVFVEGMTVDHRDVMTNSDRRGTSGNGYWRSRDLAGEVRYQWYVSAERQPFDDARGRAVCELVYRDDRLHEVRYCTGVEDVEGG